MILRVQKMIVDVKEETVDGIVVVDVVVEDIFVMLKNRENMIEEIMIVIVVVVAAAVVDADGDLDVAKVKVASPLNLASLISLVV